MYCHEASSLQTMQNNMLKVIHGLRMERLREKIKTMSVNQVAVYHTIMEVFNIIFPQNKSKISRFTKKDTVKNTNNFIRVPEISMKKCTGFTYCWAKLGI